MNHEELIALLTDLLALVPDTNVDLTSRVEMAIHDLHELGEMGKALDEAAEDLSA